MAGTAQAELRIYCICGQKMKVSESMFGLPGKCVACRQKIRVPRRDEVLPDVSEIYLKDHPEFLRKVAPLPWGDRADVRPPPEEPNAVVLGDAAEQVTVAILDILEPLRVLCSLEHKLRRQIDSLAAGQAMPASDLDRDALAAYLERVQRARIELDDQLRQRLMAVAIDSAGTQERIVQAEVSARIGEIEFRTFRGMVETLRQKRDALERLQQNLRGWLTVNDPHTAGGYTNVSLHAVPDEGFSFVLPPEDVDLRPLADQHMEGLREALMRRERAELRLRETEQLRTEGSNSSLVLADCRADSEAEKRRAQAEVVFRRKRLEQLGKDCAADIQTIDACRVRLKKQPASDGRDRAGLQRFERELLEAQRDSARVHNLVTRALVAANADEVPHPSESLLRRIARPIRKQPVRLDVDSWIAWGSALLLGLSVFLPVMDNLSPLEAYRTLATSNRLIHAIMFLPVVAGVLVTIAGAVPRRGLRGVLLLALWCTVTLLGTILIHQAQYDINIVAVRFRQGAAWTARPGMLALLVADLGLLAAAAVALVPQKRLRWVLPAGIGACAVLWAAVLTDFGGYYVPRPEITASWEEQREGPRLAYDVSVVVGNHGGRSMICAGPQSNVRNAYTFAVDRQGPGDTWLDAGVTRRNEVRIIQPGTTAVLRMRLDPGNYQARLHPVRPGLPEITAPFSLPQSAAQERAPEVPEHPASTPVPMAAASETAPKTASAAATPDTDAPPITKQPAPTPTVAAPDVELRGVVTASKREPRFSMILYEPNGPARYLDVALGDAVNDQWTVTEFNPDRQTVTLANEDRILILNRGQRIPLK
jgi:hypothetical protein